MEHNVIDNQEVKLRDELLKVLPHCEAAAFALGYFFLSGYREIHEPVSHLPKVRILTSGNTNQETVDAILGAYKGIEAARRELDRRQIINLETGRERVAEGRQALKESVEILEPEEQSVVTVRGLAEMIRQRRLDVRLYVRGTLHAKCYLLHYENQALGPGLAIVGSSNLSAAGLVHNSELNLKTTHPADFAKLTKWFEDRWDESEPFAEEFLHILDKSWAGTHLYTPRDVYYKALFERVRERFEGGEALEGVLPFEFPQLFEFQLLALRQAVQKLRKFNGVVIGDVVGLGKTYIGAALMRTMEREGFRPMVICPPHLVDMWTTFCARFEVNAKVLSHGKLRQPEFDLLAEIEFRDRDLVLIDESHNFRHKDTLQYEKLYRYMQAQNRYAILVTATPLSNSPNDVYNQIRLFHEGDQTRIPIPAPDLKAFFKAVEEGEASLADVLTHIMIRRTRRFVTEHYGEKDAKGRPCLRLNGEPWYFPDRELETVDYDIDATYGGHYEEILDLISRKHLTLARYGLYNYLKHGARDSERYAALNRVGPQLLGLMRKILLKRMESSVEAFRGTATTLADVYRMFLEAVRRGLVPAGEDQQDLIYKTAREGGATGAELDALLSEIAAQSTEYDLRDFDAEKLKRDLEKDLNTFEKIIEILAELRHRHDDKLGQLAELIDHVKPGKKILVFTEYADTAKYLDQHLGEHMKTHRRQSVVHGDIAHSRDLERIIRRFSPNYNLRPGESLTEPEIDLLISTDILAEGMNLQDARVVINYDLHWNPTRLIQRIGRVDRLSKEPMIVEVRNFLPNRKIEKELNLEQRLRARIQEIHRVIGEDNRILHPDEQLNDKAMYAIYQHLELKEGDGGDGAFGLDRVEQELRELMNSDPDYWKSLVEMPAGIRSANPSESEKTWGALVACEQGDVQEYYSVRAGCKVTRIDWEAAFRILRRAKNEPAASHPAEANGLVSSALAAFRKAQRDLDARRGRITSLPPEQRWAREQIARAQREVKDRKERAELGRLFEAYQNPITLPAAKSDLRRLRRSEMTATGALSRVVERLREIYATYDLGRREGITTPIPTRDVPRVLYARFLPDEALGRLLREDKE